LIGDFLQVHSAYLFARSKIC